MMRSSVLRRIEAWQSALLPAALRGGLTLRDGCARLSTSGLPPAWHTRRAISTRSSSTEQNAALVEQAVAAADALDRKAGELTQAVNVFKLNN
jgi:hypothetical protein